MFKITILYTILAVIGTIFVAFIVGTFIPGIERKYIQARIQQRVGPPVTSIGIMAPIKFAFKENVEINSPAPGIYKALPVVCFIVVLVIMLLLIPKVYVAGVLTSVIAIIGLLKVEEICYVLMGALSKSIMSSSLPFPDIVKGGLHLDSERSFIEDISSNRAFRLIAFGSFPLYLALIIPVIKVKSIYLSDIVAYQVAHGPILFSAAGIVAAIVFFIGYMILLNEYPFAILKTKADVIEGPYMEYASKYRGLVYLTRGFLMFVLGAIFSVLFLGMPPYLLSWKILVNIAVALIFPIIMGILSAFSPVFTNKQFYPVVIGTSLLGILAIVLTLL
ncbi:respiratory chain complex I subunit 1 family protein [Methanobrevibacter filiformis]|uniref:NAD(P)H-quinone oxidoreductase subunit 1, chloroplastic n=1 Tax=Methanobrevibacter filiformis TaxID=55758 RepID=A0A166CG55_9EURY|nr:NADH-quinone oxidoreductase subunit H [Methanobrevibacter filiformis]KZX14007.1 NAD(P)H-quinone oxidoreductase subunit 1, chloroplastic [Methanobrevibacter filiformis]